MRVNVETRVFAEQRFWNLQSILRGDKARAIGILVCFWHDTQERLIVSGTKERLLKFLPTREVEKEKIFNALVQCDYLELSSDGEYKIKGNQKHVDAVNKMKEAGKLGGVRSGEKRLIKSRQQQSLPLEHNPESVTDPSSQSKGTLQVIEPNTIQSIAKHSNTTQSITEQSIILQSNAEKEEIILPPRHEKPSTRATKVVPRGPILEFAGEVFSESLNTVAENLQKTWIKVYEDVDFIKMELKRAVVWMEANPRKKSKDFGKFMSNWLSRAHEQYRKGIPSRRKTYSELNADAAKELWNKFDQEVPCTT